MKKTCIIIAISLISAFGSCDLKVNAVSLSAKSAILMDAGNGRVLYEHNPYQKLPMASTTKIMTALIALEKGNPGDIVTISNNAAHQEGSSMYLKPGEKISLESLVYGLMLSSGNDAAVAIAEHISGSVNEFADCMTKRAKEIGAYNTSFKNPNGLDDEGHFTTAYDLALITKKALENDTFVKIVSTKNIPLEGETPRHLSNHNKMLRRYDGCIGVKTGYTKKSGRSLVSAADKNGWRIIAVTINAPDDWNDHEKLLNYGFENYNKVIVSEIGSLVGEVIVNGGTTDKVRAVYGSNYSIWLGKEEQSRLQIKTSLSDFLDAPVEVGQRIGESVATLDGEVIARIPIYTADCSFPPYRDNLYDFFVKMISIWSMQCRQDK